MLESKLKRHLQSVGKECFVRYFDLFNNARLDNADIIEVLHKECNFTEKACASRTSKARAIIREGGAIQALENIANSQRVAPTVSTLAQRHLATLTSAENQ